MKGLIMNSKTLKLLENNNNITILENNDIQPDTIYDAYIIIDESIEDNAIKEVEKTKEQEYNAEEYEEQIKVQQALFELSLTDNFSKENVEIIKSYIDKLERSQK